jgi:SAM-dependent methyltransferase
VHDALLYAVDSSWHCLLGLWVDIRYFELLIERAAVMGYLQEHSLEPGPYTGIHVLEILVEAKHYNRYLLSLIKKWQQPNFNILDFGAGIGTFALQLLRQGIQVTCIEPEPELCVRLRKAGLTVATELSGIRDESLDMIYTFNVLEHIPDDSAILQILASKLKPCGILLIYVPAFMILYSSFDRDIGHLRRYRSRNLVSLVKTAGLRVIDARYADCMGFAMALFFRAFGLEKGSVSRRAVKFYDRVLFPLSRVGDVVLHRWIGKNLVLVAIKDPSPQPASL